MSADTKTCISCNIDKPRNAEHFFYRNKARGWFSSWCKDCRKKKRQESRLTENATQRRRRRKASIRYCATCMDVRVYQNNTYCPDCSANKLRERKRRDKCLYRSRLRKATPPWANKRLIKRFYEMCPKGMVVDHIIPIRGKTISGLHVVENLQYMTPEENVKKSNHYQRNY